MNIGAKVLDIYCATRYDLDLLAAVEMDLKTEEELTHGNGPNLDTECEG